MLIEKHWWARKISARIKQGVLHMSSGKGWPGQPVTGRRSHNDWQSQGLSWKASPDVAGMSTYCDDLPFQKLATALPFGQVWQAHLACTVVCVLLRPFLRITTQQVVTPRITPSPKAKLFLQSLWRVTVSREARKWKRRSDWSAAASIFTIISHGRIWAYVWSLSYTYPETSVGESEAQRLRVLSGYTDVDCSSSCFEHSTQFC